MFFFECCYCACTALSRWICFHKRDAELIVDTWYAELQASPGDKKLYFIYLANDVAQTSRQSTDVFVNALEPVIVSACREAVGSPPDERKLKSVRHTVDVWAKRGVFPQATIGELEKLFRAKADPSPTPLPTPMNATSIDDKVASLSPPSKAFILDVVDKIAAMDASGTASTNAGKETLAQNSRVFYPDILQDLKSQNDVSEAANDLVAAEQAFTDYARALAHLAAAQQAVGGVLSSFLTSLNRASEGTLEAKGQVDRLLAAVPEQKNAMRSIFQSFASFNKDTAQIQPPQKRQAYAPP